MRLLIITSIFALLSGCASMAHGLGTVMQGAGNGLASSSQNNPRPVNCNYTVDAAGQVTFTNCH